MKKPTLIKSFIIISGFFILLLNACQEEFENISTPPDIPDIPQITSGNFKLHLTDAPFPTELVDEANITITKIAIRKSDGEEGDSLITLSEEEETFNLLDLNNGVTEILADTALESGTYTQIRLYVSEANVIMVDSTIYDLKVPSGAQSGIKISLGQGITLSEEDSTELLLDFDVSKSFVVKGNPNTPAGIKGFNFKPVIRLSNLETDGSLEGIVQDTANNPIGDVWVDVIAADTVYASTSTELDGTYKILGIEEGTYKVEFSKDGFTTKVKKNVKIKEASTTTLDAVLSE